MKQPSQSLPQHLQNPQQSPSTASGAELTTKASEAVTSDLAATSVSALYQARIYRSIGVIRSKGVSVEDFALEPDADTAQLALVSPLGEPVRLAGSLQLVADHLHMFTLGVLSQCP